MEEVFMGGGLVKATLSERFQRAPVKVQRVSPKLRGYKLLKNVLTISFMCRTKRVPYSGYMCAVILLGCCCSCYSSHEQQENGSQARDGTLIANRKAPPEGGILLANGTTVFITSLEDFLDQSEDDRSSRRAASLAQNSLATNQEQFNSSPSHLAEASTLSAPVESHIESRREIDAGNDGGAKNSSSATLIEREDEASTGPQRGVQVLPVANNLNHNNNNNNNNAPISMGEQEHSSHSKHEEHNSPPHDQHHNHNNHHHQHHTNSGNQSGPKPIPQHWQVKSLLNVTHDYPLAYSQIICGYIWPLMAGVTMFTNLMIVFVLTQRDMRSPTNIVITAIAIADIIPIVVPVPWFVYLFAMGNEKQVLYPPVACYFYQHSTRSVSEVFYFLSTWLNVLLAVLDYFTACWPHLAKKYCQTKLVVCEILALTLLAFLLNLPQALKLVFKPVKFYYNGQLTWGCRAAQAKWFKDLVGEYVALYDDIFTAIIVVFVDGGPSIALVWLTALLIRELKRQKIKGTLLMEQARTASHRRRERHRQQEHEASARTMILVLLAFIVVKISFATTYTLMIIQSRFEIHFVESLTDFQKAISITDLVSVLSYPVNFTIFCCCSKKFRHKCVQLLAECDRNTQTAKTRLWSRISDSFNQSFNSQDKEGLSGSDETNQGERKYKPNSMPSTNSISSELVMSATELEGLTSLERAIIHANAHFDHSYNNHTNSNEMDSRNSHHFQARRQKPGCHLFVHHTGAEMDEDEQHRVLEQTAGGQVRRQGRHTSDQDRSSEMKAQLVAGSRHFSYPPAPPLLEIVKRPLCSECAARHHSGLMIDTTQGYNSSADSAGWPSSEAGMASAGLPLPPPPPPISISEFQLPAIVTVECGDEYDSRGDDSPETEEADRPFVPTGGELTCSGGVSVISGDGPDGVVKQGRSSSATLQLADSERRQHLGDEHQGHRGWSGGRGSRQEGGGSTGELEVGDSRALQANLSQMDRDVVSNEQLSGQLSLIRPPRRCSSRGTSDPGGNFIKQLRDFVRRSDVGLEKSKRSSQCSIDQRQDADRSSRGENEGGRRSPSDWLSVGSMLDSKRRSISLSHTKLTALPNATGLLADILKTTLLTTNRAPRSNERNTAPGRHGGEHTLHRRESFARQRQRRHAM